MKRIFQRRSWWFCFDSDIVKIRFQIFLKRREFSNRIALWSKIFSSVRGICESNKGGDLFRGVQKSNEAHKSRKEEVRAFSTDPVDCASRHGEILVRRVLMASKVFVVESRSSRGRYVLCRAEERRDNRIDDALSKFDLRPPFTSGPESLHSNCCILWARLFLIYVAHVYTLQFRVGNGSKVDSNLRGMFFLPFCSHI